jgi:hypothetical protein
MMGDASRDAIGKEAPMAVPTIPTALSVGFLTVLQEGSGYLGGYLVTNQWGRPLEFRLSSAVQPNRVHQILYGGTLQAYVCADLIGKTLVDKTSVAVQLVVTDSEPVLDLRLKLAVPVVWLAATDNPVAAALAAGGAGVPGGEGQRTLVCHPRFTGDVAAVREILDKVEGTLDLADPFVRIREAVGEARRMGTASRAA